MKMTNYRLLRSIRSYGIEGIQRGTHRGNRLATWVALAAVGSAAVLLAVTPAAASAASSLSTKALPPNLAKFAHCPVGVKGVTLCLFSSTTSTTFQIGSTTVSSTSPTTLSIGVRFKKGGAEAIVVLPTDGSQALQAAPIPLPGGLSGIPGLGSGDLAVDVTPQLVGIPSLSLGNLLTGDGPGLVLPIDVLVSTPSGVLGSDCTIADAATPIDLNLTTGTTDPPSPNTPISGSPGSLVSKPNGLQTVTGMSLVDNAFAVPGTDNCGSDGILDEILDVDKSLPSAAGSNSAILSGASYTAPASLISQYIG
jgi:hypothetical protein